MSEKICTKVVIIGAGPSGLLLSQLLHVAGIESIILEQRSKEYVLSRIRAGILEQSCVDMLERAGVAARLHREGLPHTGIGISVDGESFRVDLAELTGGKQVTVYGQTEITLDMMDIIEARGGGLVFEAQAVTPHNIDGAEPYVTYTKDGVTHVIKGDFIVGCDGFHGVARTCIPQNVLKTYERVYPFGWLGILADVPPCDHELIYANHSSGFALASMRSTTRSRYYVQCSLDEKLEDWPDERIWDELAIRLGSQAAANITRGRAIEKSIAPLRSFVAEPMCHGRLFLAGDAGHIVPPTGAKGLNLAASDVHYLSEALIAFFRTGLEDGLLGYSQKALDRIWKAERFSWWFTSLTHRFPSQTPFDRKMQIAEIAYIRGSRNAQAVLAENYVGLPY